jgi:peptide/nickel transport system substrate-binding protein
MSTCSFAGPIRKRLLAMAFSGVAGLLLATGASVPAGAQPTTLTVAQREPTRLNFNWDLDLTTPYVLQNIQSKLFDINFRNEVIPILAESWEVTDDAKTYTVKLHEGVKWHHGPTLTADDVVFSYQKSLEVGGPAEALLANLVEVRAVDPLTVAFELSEPTGNFLETLANYYGVYIVPKDLYDDGTDVRANPLNNAPPGTGPFKFVEWVQGSHIVLEANPDYFEGAPGVDRLVFRFMDHLPTVVSALEVGEIDSTQLTIPFGEVPRVQGLPGLEVTIVPKANPSWMGFNLRRAPFDDVRVRQAIAHAIDRDLLADVVFGGLAPPEQTAWLSVVEWANNPDALQPAYDPERAMQLLDEAGLAPGAGGERLRLTITAFRGATLWGMPESAEFIRDQLRAVGITAVIQLVDSATWTDMVNVRHEFDLAIAGGLRGPDPNDFAVFVGDGGSRNAMGYRNERVEELLDLGRSTADRDARREIYFELQEIIANEVPLITLIATVDPYIHNTRFEGFPWQEENRDRGRAHYFGMVRPAE